MRFATSRINVPQHEVVRYGVVLKAELDRLRVDIRADADFFTHEARKIRDNTTYADGAATDLQVNFNNYWLFTFRIFATAPRRCKCPSWAEDTD